MKKFAPMMGAFSCVFEHLSTYHGYLFGNFSSTWGKKWPFSFKITQFLPIMGGFSENFAPMMGAFSATRHGGCSHRGPHIRSNFLSEYPHPPGPGHAVGGDFYSTVPKK